MKHSDPTIFIAEVSLKITNLNPEAVDVKTLNNEFVIVF